MLIICISLSLTLATGPRKCDVNRPTQTMSESLPLLPPSSLLNPSRLRIPDTRTLDDCIRYWDLGDERRGLPLPLKDWPKTFKPSTYRSEAVKWGKIQKVMHEFHDVCASNRGVFESHYPGLSSQYAKLCKAVNIKRQERGELSERPKKRRRVEDSNTADV
jgi:hypothetical protein